MEAVDGKIDVENPLITCRVKKFSFSRYDTIILDKKFNSIAVAANVSHITKRLKREDDTMLEKEVSHMSTGTIIIIVILALILR